MVALGRADRAAGDRCLAAARAADAGRRDRGHRRGGRRDRRLHGAAQLAKCRCAGAGHERSPAEPGRCRHPAEQSRLRHRRSRLDIDIGARRDRQCYSHPLQDRAARFLHSAPSGAHRRTADGARRARPRRRDTDPRRRLKPARHHPAPRPLDHRHPDMDTRPDRDRLQRGDGLPEDRPADVRAAQGDLDRAVPAQHQPDRAQQHHADRDQPALHRSLHGRPQSRVRPQAAVARVSDRPARQLFPPVLGRTRLHRQRGAERGSAQGEALRHPGAAPLGAGLRSSASTTTATRRANRRSRRPCWSSAASC